MKNIFRLFVLLGVLAFASCEDKDGLNNVFDKPAFSDQVIEISVSSEELSLNESTQWDNFTISWTEAVPPTDEYYIESYKVFITPNDQPTAEPMKLEVDGKTTSHEIVLRDLYLHMYNNWAYTSSQPMDLKIEVIAVIGGWEFYYKPVVTEKLISMTPVEIPVRTFYINGEAGSGAIPCTQQGYSDQLNQILDAKLKPNSTFVLSLQPDAKFPAFMRKAKLEGDFVDGWEAVLVNTEAEAANYEPFETLGEYHEQALGDRNVYAVSVEFDTKTFGANVYIGRMCTSEAWAVGDCINRSWGPWVKFNWDYKYPDVLYLAQEFFDATQTGSEGAFKISNRNNNWGDWGACWRPASGGADPRSDHRVVSQYDGDPKFKLPDGAGGFYICVLNNAEMTIDMIPMQ
ncbi:MAG: hypothetical protein J6L01_02250 [Alistipes sp.]|nr:hypothetical protein [Alistipes sp.]